MPESIVQEAIEFLERSNDADSTNRSEEMEDLRFSYGDQWPQQMQNQRNLEQRPWFTFNETETYIKQVCNQIRQQRPRIRCQGVNNQSQEKIAQIITGIMRHIEEASDADTAYDTAMEYAVRIGRGYFRLGADYVNDKSFDQDIKILPIYNPFSVYFDPNSWAPDGSDAEQCVITDLISKEMYARLYPDADMTQFNMRGTGDGTSEWITKDDIRIAEYFKIEREKRTLYHLSDGAAVWDDKMIGEEALKKVGVKVKGTRQSYRKQVCWYKVNGIEVLDERVLPGCHIPVIPVYGAHMIIDGRTQRYGIVRCAKDPQRVLNFMKTAVIETVSMAPKAKHLIAEGQDDGFEHEWDQANVRALSRLHYRNKDEAGEQLPPPIPIPPPPVPDGFMATAQASHDDLQRVLGMFDPAMTAPGNTSGKAMNAMQQQSDMSNFHFYDNLTRSIKHAGRIGLSWIPTYYSEKRVMRIIGDDGKPDLITINDQNAIGKIENDVTVGEYDVVMETGPGYNSKRQEAYELMSNIAQAWPPFMQVAGDLLFRNSDIPGAEVIADRLAAQNPLAQIDDKSDVPPKAQMMIKQLQAQLQQTQGQLSQAGMLIKERGDIATHKEAGETHRTQIQEDAETRRHAMTIQAKLEDTHTRAQAQLGVAELDGVIKLLTQIKDQAHERGLAVFGHVANAEEAKLGAALTNGAASGAQNG
jgi:hypothetical protein